MGANSTRLSPRQKMINLMYIVLTAMLALNVSSDVLDGFTQVHEGLKRSNSNFDNRNTAIYGQLESIAEQNPDKGKAWLDKATEVRNETRNLYAYVDSLKTAIVQKADGKDGDPDNILNRDDLESAAVVMLAPGRQNGARLARAHRQLLRFRKRVYTRLAQTPYYRRGTVHRTGHAYRHTHSSALGRS